MITIDSTTKTQKNSSTNKPIYLYTIFDYDGLSNNLYFAESDADVTYNGQLYTRFPITHESINDNAQGEIEGVKVSVSNVSRVIQSYLELYDWRKKRVVIRLVWADQLADTDAYIDFTYYIDSYTANEKMAEFSLLPKIDILDVNIPYRVYSRNYCSWKFKSTECGYSGATGSCNKTKAACKAMAGGSNYQRYGGFPSIPTRRIYAG
ncbi:MAG: hypothetical protein PHE15_02745 [Dehalococcoidales bacterium]|nr:hypothetical protein [Dehalococcoidales bacterium]